MNTQKTQAQNLKKIFGSSAEAKMAHFEPKKPFLEKSSKTFH